MGLEHSDPTVFYLKNVPVDRNGRYETPEGKERGGGLPMLITWMRMMQNPLQHGNIFGRLVTNSQTFFARYGCRHVLSQFEGYKMRGKTK